ncbi:hypothetical protein C8F04DRAFT_1248374 [Mycena alexandri]|uniref:Uncharacterized protein n=1 Tax=Mycena alexandri TaxID=1745969 RepID=A0AAD6TIV9_9AGAR|nr:hypothetical protein C8F04DRAFT_1248374 [Mycena alexandri]
MPPFDIFLETIVRLRITGVSDISSLYLPLVIAVMIAAAPLDGEMDSMIAELPFDVPPLPGSVGQLLPFAEAKSMEPSSALDNPGSSAFAHRSFVSGIYLNDTQIDRLEFIFQNKGYQVYPTALETRLLSLEVVDNVIDRSSERFGEFAVAFVVSPSLGRDRDPAIKF